MSLQKESPFLTNDSSNESSSAIPRDPLPSENPRDSLSEASELTIGSIRARLLALAKSTNSDKVQAECWKTLLISLQTTQEKPPIQIEVILSPPLIQKSEQSKIIDASS